MSAASQKLSSGEYIEDGKVPFIEMPGTGNGFCYIAVFDAPAEITSFTISSQDTTSITYYIKMTAADGNPVPNTNPQTEDLVVSITISTTTTTT